jgi:hypothetical protein
MTLDILRNKIDFLELMQFCVRGGPLVTENYYHFLDLGFQITALAGSDFPWCGIGPQYGVMDAPKWNSRIGDVRFYTYIEGEFSYENWRKGMKAGHTFATSGPILDFTINGKLPGDQLNVKKGENLEIKATALGHAQQVPLQTLEIIAHGATVELAAAGSDAKQTNEKLTISAQMQVEHGIWIAAKCQAGPNQLAHSTPVYVSVDGGGFYNSKKAGDYLDKCETYLREIETEINKDGAKARSGEEAWRYKEGLQKRVDEVRGILGELRKKLI